MLYSSEGRKDVLYLMMHSTCFASIIFLYSPKSATLLSTTTVKTIGLKEAFLKFAQLSLSDNHIFLFTIPLYVCSGEAILMFKIL